jgi:CubicO group peptidase (beta-lactamase class C family)
MKININVIILILLFIGLSSSCNNKIEKNVHIGSDLVLSTPLERYNFSNDKFDKAINLIKNNFPQLRSVLIIKNEALIFSWYRKNVEPNEVVEIHSGAKIITALMVGIAIEKGIIKDEYITISDIYNEYFFDNDKKDINENILSLSIDDLLCMRGGIQFSDVIYSLKTIKQRINSNSNVIVNTIRLKQNPSYIKNFLYQTENYLIVQAMIMEASKTSDYEFISKYLFQPLDISPITYLADYEGIGNISRYLYLRPMDYAKIGMLLLNEGRFMGEQIISKEWIKNCMVKHTNGPGPEYLNQENMDFGYGLWRYEKNNMDIIFSYGKNGQYLIIIPDMDILISTTSDEKDFTFSYREKLIEWFFGIE